MHRVEDRTERGDPNATRLRQKQSALGKTTVLALLGSALTYLFQFFFVWLVVGTLLPPVLVFAIVAFILAGLVAARLRWAPLLGVLFALATSTIMLLVPETTSALSHPAVNPGHFGTDLLGLAFALVTMIAGGAATIQNYGRGERRAPRWLGPTLTGVAGLVVGMIVVASVVAASPAGVPTNTTTNGMLTVHMAGSNFLTNVVLVPKGSKLVLVDDDSNEHIIGNGSWTASGNPQPQAEPGAPVVHSLDIKSGSVVIGPFNTAGIFHLYCSIHRGMNLTVVVQ